MVCSADSVEGDLGSEDYLLDDHTTESAAPPTEGNSTVTENHIFHFSRRFNLLYFNIRCLRLLSLLEHLADPHFCEHIEYGYPSLDYERARGKESHEQAKD